MNFNVVYLPIHGSTLFHTLLILVNSPVHPLARLTGLFYMKEQRPWTINKDRQHIYRTVYNTQRWKKLRAMFLQSNPICIRCKDYGIITKALVVDHIIPIRKGGSAWSIDNLQPLCDKCHQVKTNQDIHKHTKQ